MICRYYPFVYLFGQCHCGYWLFCCCKSFEITEIIWRSDMVRGAHTNRQGKQLLRAPGFQGVPSDIRKIFGKCTSRYFCYGERQMFTHHSKRRVFVRCRVLQACEFSHYNNV